MLFPNKNCRSIVIMRVPYLSQYKDNTFPPYIQIKKHQPFGQCLIKLFYDFSCLISTQFEIIKFRKGDDDKDLSVNGKCPYFRILIKRIS